MSPSLSTTFSEDQLVASTLWREEGGREGGRGEGGGGRKGERERKKG